jgi:hypothetical protein
MVMNSRQRFLESMSFGSPDRVPLFGEGIRSDVFKVWGQTKLKNENQLQERFTYDRREEIYLNLDPYPALDKLPSTFSELDILRASLDPDDPVRLPSNWDQRVQGLLDRDYPLMMRVHEGFFLAMGVSGWQRFNELMELCTDAPDFVSEYMAIYSQFSAQVTDRLLRDVRVDAIVFSEPIGGNDGPLISPMMHEEFVANHYAPIMDVIAKYQIETVILRTYANARVILPNAVNYGINCLWACEVEPQAMDYLEIKRNFGRDLRLMAGIDIDALLHDKATVRREVERVVPPLLEAGGYIPLLDGRVRVYIPFENYEYYRELLQEIV